MKKIVFSAAVLFFLATSVRVMAQDEKMREKDEFKTELDEKKQSQEIIIRKKGDKDTKITVEINGDKVIINGKPLSEFKDDEITVNKRKITMWDKNGSNSFDFDYSPGDFMQNYNWNSDGKEEPYPFLGVTTEENDNRAKITQITKESAAEKAGLKIKDSAGFFLKTLPN